MPKRKQPEYVKGCPRRAAIRTTIRKWGFTKTEVAEATAKIGVEKKTGRPGAQEGYSSDYIRAIIRGKPCTAECLTVIEQALENLTATRLPLSTTATLEPRCKLIGITLVDLAITAGFSNYQAGRIYAYIHCYETPRGTRAQRYRRPIEALETTLQQLELNHAVEQTIKGE